MKVNELVFANMESAFKVAELLLAECYVVMLSREDEFFVLNYQYSELSDRNDVVFISAEEYEERINSLYRSAVRQTTKEKEHD